MSNKYPEIQSLSSCFNEDGEPIMTYEQYRYEMALDQQAQDEWEPDYDEEQGRYDAYMEDVYEQQQEGQCPACGEDGCEASLRVERDRYTGQTYVIHKS